MAEKELNTSVFVSISDLATLKNKIDVSAAIQPARLSYHLTGEKKSPFKSKGLDFQEVRSYYPGDDIRQIDWRMTAKYGKPFTKLYTDEKAHSVLLIVDMRPQMQFASQGDFKSVIAARLTAILSFIAMSYQDIIKAVVLLPTGTKTFMNIRNETDVFAFFKTISDASNPLTTQNNTIAFEQGLTAGLAVADKGAAVFIISDFYDFETDSDVLMAHLAKNRNLTFIHIFDALEQHLPHGAFPITDGQKTITVQIHSTQNQTYLNQFNQRKNHITKLANMHDAGYLSIPTTADYIADIRAYCL